MMQVARFAAVNGGRVVVVVVEVVVAIVVVVIVVVVVACVVGGACVVGVLVVVEGSTSGGVTYITETMAAADIMIIRASMTLIMPFFASSLSEGLSAVFHLMACRVIMSAAIPAAMPYNRLFNPPTVSIMPAAWAGHMAQNIRSTTISASFKYFLSYILGTSNDKEPSQTVYYPPDF